MTAAEVRAGGLGGAVAAEWTKFWSVRATWWTLACGAALMPGYGALSGLTQRYGGESPVGAPEVVVGGGFYLSQFAVIALATLFVTSEYAGGGIRSTLLWTPVRSRVLLGKAAVLLPVLFAYGVAVAGAGMAAFGLLEDGHGLPAPWAAGITAATRLGGYFALLGLLCTGVAWALRSTAGTLVVVAVLLVPLPLIVASLGLPALMPYFPGTAGMNAMVEAGHPNPLTGEAAPYAPWAGTAICAAWAAAALLTGDALLRRRDA